MEISVGFCSCFNRKNGGVHRMGGVRFITFVDSVLIRTSESRTDIFRLRCSFHLNARINNALKHKVRVLELCMDRVEDYSLALAPFAGENLVVLKLGRNFELDISGSFSFLSLKVFHLELIEFSRCSSTQKLFSSCTAFENLVIQECKFNKMRSLRVSAPKLKSLVIDCLSYERYGDDYDNSDEEYADYWAGNGNAFSDYEIAVDAPKLKILRYKGYAASGCSFKNFHFLVRAIIDISDNGKRRDFSALGLQLLISTHNAKFLSSSNRSTKCGLLLPKLLEKSPNLEEPVLDKENAKLNARHL